MNSVKDVLFFALSLSVSRTLCTSDCLDIRGRLIAHGLHFVPGPDTCNLCICDNGQAKHCKAVIFSPPQDCRSFRVGNSCYEFICLDDVVKPPGSDGGDLNVRIMAGAAIVAILALAAVLIYKIKVHKQSRPPHIEDQRSLNSIGYVDCHYIGGGMAYIGGTCETGLSSWKPPNNYLPRGEAPPPYDEAVAQSRAEAIRLVCDPGFHRSFPTTVESLARPEDMVRFSGHTYENVLPPMAQVTLSPLVPHDRGVLARPEDMVRFSGHTYENVLPPMTQIPNPSTGFNAPLLQSVCSADGNNVSPNYMPRRHMTHSGIVGAKMIRLTGSLGTITNRGLLSLLQQRDAPPTEVDRPQNVPGFYTTDGAVIHNSLHRTIPRISTAIDTTVLDSSLPNFNRADRILQNEIRRSFHKPNENTRRTIDTNRSMPRNLNLVSNLESNRIDSVVIDSDNRSLVEDRKGVKDSVEATPSTSKAVNNACAVQEKVLPSAPTLPLTVDKPSCVCSYDNSPVHESEETDDYRSECANCKSASSSKWRVGEEWAEEEDEGTQTLQRRAPPPAPPTPATATLPQLAAKQRTTMAPTSSNWDNWFHAIPDSDTESEEE